MLRCRDWHRRSKFPHPGVTGAPNISSFLISVGGSRFLNEPPAGDGLWAGGWSVPGAVWAAGGFLAPLLPRLLGWGRTSFDFAVRDGLSVERVGVQHEAGGAAGTHLLHH